MFEPQAQDHESVQILTLKLRFLKVINLFSVVVFNSIDELYSALVLICVLGLHMGARSADIVYSARASR